MGICEDLPGHAAEIVLEWDRLASTEPQLSLLPREGRWDALPEAIAGLLKASLCQPEAPDVQRELVTAALRHGQDRRSADVPPDVIFTEYAMLHRAIWHHLQRTSGPEERLAMILKADMAISLATRASLAGYHRSEMEATGSWAGIVDHLVGEALLFNKQT